MLKKNNRFKKIGLPQKNFSENSDKITTVKPGFNVNGGRGRSKNVSILPSHREVFRHYKDNGFRHIGKAIRKTGVFSESLAHNPQTLTQTKSWKALMDEKFSEDKVASRHSELLDKRDYRKVVDAFGIETMVDDGPNTAAVSKGVELAYRLRGAFKEKEALPPSTVMYNLFYKPEVREQMKHFEEGIKKSLEYEVSRKYKAELLQEEKNQELLDGQE